MDGGWRDPANLPEHQGTRRSTADLKDHSMRLTSFFLLAILITGFMWMVGEVSAFLYVADHLGFAGALILTVATSYLGILLLRRIGVAARQNLFDLLRRSDSGFISLQGGLRDGALAAFGASLLILPGFLSDIVGGAFALASSRFWLTARNQPAEMRDPEVVDLSPDDWRRLDTAGNLPRRRETTP